MNFAGLPSLYTCRDSTDFCGEKALYRWIGLFSGTIRFTVDYFGGELLSSRVIDFEGDGDA